MANDTQRNERVRHPVERGQADQNQQQQGGQQARWSARRQQQGGQNNPGQQVGQ